MIAGTDTMAGHGAAAPAPETVVHSEAFRQALGELNEGVGALDVTVERNIFFPNSSELRGRDA